MFQSIIFIVLAVYIGLILLLFLFQKRIIYHPGSTVYQTPEVAGMAFEELYLDCEDGAKINAWYIPAEGAKYTVLFCHGNAGTIAGRVDSAKLLHDIGVNVMLFDYRGYGNSKGELSEEGTYIDGETAWNHLVKEKKISPGSIIILGRSLGGGIALNLAVNHKSAALILESAFMSISEMGKSKYPYLPIFLFVRYHYSNIDKIKKVKEPLFISHSTEDEVIPFFHGKRLYEAANEPKTFVKLNGYHNDCYFTNPEYQLRLRDFIESL